MSSAAPVAGRIRVVVAKPGLDGHDRGAKVVARALRDAGMEVIYTGLHQTPEQIVETAVQEDADCIGLSVLSGAHLTLFARVLDLLAARGADDVVVFGGGIIPEDDIAQLTALGVATVFTPGATTQSIVEWVRDARRGARRRLIPTRSPRCRTCSLACADTVVERTGPPVDLMEYQAKELFAAARRARAARRDGRHGRGRARASPSGSAAPSS